MQKKILITSTDLMMIQFLVPHIKNLAMHNFEVEIACSEVGGRLEEVKKAVEGYAKAVHQVRLHRSPATPENLKGYKDMKNVIDQGKYDLIWTNEPVMGVVTRLAARKARKQGTKVLYMVHGFHFYKGAPKKYWLAFFPIEKFAGYFCDSVVTVNKEDYKRAKRMKLPDVRYIHGIGINTARLTPGENRNDIRKELGLPDDAFLVLSIGELNENKNQKTIIDAIEKINDPKIHYILCGKGDQLDNLQSQASVAGIAKNVHFLGYRTDVIDICSQSDVYVMPSHREGLPVASLEAMYCGLPLVTSNIRGLVDVMKNGVSGYMYSPDDVYGFANGIKKLKEDPELRKKMATTNQKAVIPYCIDHTLQEVLALFEY